MNELKPFAMGNDEGSWKTQNFRQSVVIKIEEAIQRSGMPTSRNSGEMENHVFQKAQSKEEYLSMVARLILHVREINTKKAGLIASQNAAAQGQIKNNSILPGGPNQPNVSQPPNQLGQGGQGPGGNQGMAPDPINALQNLASQGSRNNQMMNNMGGPQMQGMQGVGPGNQIPGMPNQMGPQGPMVSQQNAPITATNLLQTLNQRPQMTNMQLQNKLVTSMGMVPNQVQMGPGNMMGSMGQMQGHMGNQIGGPQIGMQNQMGSNMSVSNAMQNQMVGINTMAGQMISNQMNPSMAAQMGATGPNQMAVQMGNMVQNQMSGQAAQMSIMQHMQQQQQRKPEQIMSAGVPANQQPGNNFPGAPRTQAPGQFLRQSPSPSAPSPAGMGGPSPASMSVMSGPMASPMSVGNVGVGCGPAGGVASPALAPSPSAHHSQHSQHMQQPQRSIGMASSPGSALNTPLGAGGAAPSPLGSGGMASGMTGNIQGDEHAYREKVRQLSKYIEPLRRMIARMVSDGENVEKLTKMKNLLDILSHPSKRMPLETLLKCEVVLEKLDFKRGESNPLHLHGLKEHQIFNPLLEVVNNSLQSPLANHTLKRTFGPCMEALSGPEIKNMPPPLKMVKLEEPPPDIPDVLQGEIARLDSRFKVSLETMQLTGVTSVGGEEGGSCGGGGAVRLTAHLDDARLPCVPPVQLSVPRDYPASPPSLRLRPLGPDADASSFPAREEKALAARLARLPAACSVSQLLDAWEMSVRQACAPDENLTYTPVPALGI